MLLFKEHFGLLAQLVLRLESNTDGTFSYRHAKPMFQQTCFTVVLLPLSWEKYKPVVPKLEVNMPAPHQRLLIRLLITTLKFWFLNTPEIHIFSFFWLQMDEALQTSEGHQKTAQLLLWRFFRYKRSRQTTADCCQRNQVTEASRMATLFTKPLMWPYWMEGQVCMQHLSIGLNPRHFLTKTSSPPTRLTPRVPFDKTDICVPVDAHHHGMVSLIGF